MVRHGIILILLALATAAGASRLTTFEWNAASGWPAGTTVELCANDLCASGITATQHTLDVPVEPGEVIQARARAHAGDQSSPWVDLAQTWPASPIGVRAIQERTAMAAVVTGTAAGLTFEVGTATPTAVNVTVPADATAAYVFWTYFGASGTDGVSAATLGGTAYSQKYDYNATSDYYSTGVIAFYSPATGTKSLSITWATAPPDQEGSGPSVIIVYTKDGNTTAWRDADGTSGATSASVTLTTESADLVLALDGHYDIAGPGDASGWTTLASFVQRNCGIKARNISASGASQVAASVSSSYPAITAIAIPAAGGAAASIVPILMRQYASQWK